MICTADLVVDLARHSVTRAGEPVELTPTEFSPLMPLAQEPGRAFTRSRLLEVAQGEAFVGYERTADAHIKHLRAQLERDPKQPKYIETVFGVGYRFNDP